MEVSLAVEAAGAVRGVVHAGLARFIAGRALPVGRSPVSNGSSRADLVTVALVHVVTICTVVAIEVFSALQATF